MGVDVVSIIPWSKGKFIMWDSTYIASLNLKMLVEVGGCRNYVGALKVCNLLTA